MIVEYEQFKAELAKASANEDYDPVVLVSYMVSCLRFTAVSGQEASEFTVAGTHTEAFCRAAQQEKYAYAAAYEAARVREKEARKLQNTWTAVAYGIASITIVYEAVRFAIYAQWWPL